MLHKKTRPPLQKIFESLKTQKSFTNYYKNLIKLGFVLEYAKTAHRAVSLRSALSFSADSLKNSL
jgi:hypothetical protein